MKKPIKTSLIFITIALCYNLAIGVVITPPILLFFFFLVGNLLIITIFADVITAQQNKPQTKEQFPQLEKQPEVVNNNPQTIRRSQCGNFEFSPSDGDDTTPQSWENVKTNPAILTQLKPKDNE